VKKTLVIRKPLPPFQESALKARCPVCGYGPGDQRWHTLKASFDELQTVRFLVVLCLRCGGLVERYAPVRP